MADEYPTFGIEWIKRWAQTAKGEGTLHRIAVVVEDWDTDRYYAVRNCVAVSACGLRKRFFMPGIFSRTGAPRCKRCCAKAGIPAGDGVPANDGAFGQDPLLTEAQKNA